MVTSGWRCCACQQSVSSRQDRPADTGSCRIDENSAPSAMLTGQPEPDLAMMDWIRLLTKPAGEQRPLNGNGHRRLRSRHGNHFQRSDTR